MKFRFGPILALLTMISLSWYAPGYSDQFPTNFSLDSLHKADLHPKQFDGRIIAFRGRVTTVQQLADGKQYFFVQFVNPNPKNEGIWVLGFINLRPQDLLVGHNVAVLAYFRLTDPKHKTISQIQKKAYQALGFCIANASTQMGLYSKEVGGLCSEWQNGKIPASEADTSAVRFVEPEDQKK